MNIKLPSFEIHIWYAYYDKRYLYKDNPFLRGVIRSHFMEKSHCYDPRHNNLLIIGVITVTFTIEMTSCGASVNIEYFVFATDSTVKSM